jgi:hypothetical protein
VVKAYAYRTADDPRPGVGHAWESYPGSTAFTRTSELMVGETSAWGRALAALGIAVSKSIASKNEVRAAEARKTERSKEPTADDDPFYTNAAAPVAKSPHYDNRKKINVKQIGLLKGQTNSRRRRARRAHRRLQRPPKPRRTGSDRCPRRVNERAARLHSRQPRQNSHGRAIHVRGLHRSNREVIVPTACPQCGFRMHPAEAACLACADRNTPP